MTEIEAIPQKKIRLQVVHGIQLTENPRLPHSKKLSDYDRYRIRQGVYRILYEIEDDKLVVYVVKVGHRKDVYREAL